MTRCISIADALKDQFRRTWKPIRRVIEECPPEAWTAPVDYCDSPAVCMYHTMYWWDHFTRARRLDAGGGFSEERPPTREQALAYHQAVGEQVEAWLGRRKDEQFLKPLRTARTGRCMLARAMYYLRHNQHHLADMQIVLRQLGVDVNLWL